MRHTTAQCFACGTLFERLTSLTSLVSLAEFARQIGKTRQYVHKLVKQERLKKSIVMDRITGKQLIDCQKAQKILAGESLSSNEKSFSDDFDMTYDEARRMKMIYEAKQEKIKYEKEIGKLILSEEVQKYAHQTGIVIRDKLMAIPAKIAPIVAGENSIFEIKNTIAKEIRSVLSEMTSGKWKMEFANDDKSIL